MAEEATETGKASRQLALACGVTLELKPARMGPIRHLLVKMGGLDLLVNPERLRSLDDEGKVRAAGVLEQLFTYLVGWGVKDDPPTDALDELSELGLLAKSKQTTRANWVRFLLLEDDDEMATIIGATLTVAAQHAAAQVKIAK